MKLDFIYIIKRTVEVVTYACYEDLGTSQKPEGQYKN